MRSLCVGFWSQDTIAICIRTDIPLANSRGCIMLQEVRSPLWPMSFPVYASVRIVQTSVLLYDCNTRYEWLVRPYSPGTFTLEETPSFAWRTLCTLQLCRSACASSTTATLGMNGWLGLIHQGLSPWKKRQASLGALTVWLSESSEAAVRL